MFGAIPEIDPDQIKWLTFNQDIGDWDVSSCTDFKVKQ